MDIRVGTQFASDDYMIITINPDNSSFTAFRSTYADARRWAADCQYSDQASCKIFMAHRNGTEIKWEEME
jgi:hypothetical protein